jgi:hypothetical protein
VEENMKNTFRNFYQLLKIVNPGIYLVLLSVVCVSVGYGQVESTEKKYIRIGSLQSHVSAYASERAWNNSYYEGLRWPAEYLLQDNSVIKRFWIAASPYTDILNNEWEAIAIYFSAGWAGESIFPVELSQTARYAAPIVYVNGNNITAPYAGDVDAIDENQFADRIVTNVVHTTIGVTVTRKFYAFAQQHHDNYFIKEFIFTNTGNTDYDSEVERTAPVFGFRIGWGERYSVCREGATKIHSHQGWGKHSWCTRRGENYADHYGESITLDNPIVDWIRCGFQWAGQFEDNAYDNLGGPDIVYDGRLTAPHHAGVAILHVDKSAADTTDDPDQPITLGWHAGDTYPGFSTISKSSEPAMIQVYSMLSGFPHTGLGGNERMDDVYLESNPDPFTVHNDAGGTNLWVNYGPFDLEHGESIRIIEAQGVAGLSRPMCELLGQRWKQAYDNPDDKGPFILPDGSETTDKDIYKNAWVHTGKDSMLLTFSRAKRNFDMGFQIPQPPQPPPIFEVNSGGDKISLSWAESPSETDPNFGGYKVFRAVGKSDTVFSEIFACGYGTDQENIVYQYDDVTAIRGYAYYYYVVSFSDGTENNTQANPPGQLHSSRYYTRTTEPAYLKRLAVDDLSKIRIVPNPFYINARNLTFPNEPDKIMFYNIPGQCTIKIYTERGDLISKIEHIDGSGDQAWNSITDSRQVVVSGVYIAHISKPSGESIIKKFIVIR